MWFPAHWFEPKYLFSFRKCRQTRSLMARVQISYPETPKMCENLPKRVAESTAGIQVDFLGQPEHWQNFPSKY